MPAVLTNSGMARHQHIDALVLGEFDIVHRSWRRRMGPGWLWDTVALIKASFASSLVQSAKYLLKTGAISIISTLIAWLSIKVRWSKIFYI